jgi:hypothetical protein
MSSTELKALKKGTTVSVKKTDVFFRGLTADGKKALISSSKSGTKNLTEVSFQAIKAAGAPVLVAA